MDGGGVCGHHISVLPGLREPVMFHVRRRTYLSCWRASCTVPYSAVALGGNTRLGDQHSLNMCTRRLVQINVILGFAGSTIINFVLRYSMREFTYHEIIIRRRIDSRLRLP